MPNHFDTDPALHERLLARVLLGDNGAARQLARDLSPVIRSAVYRVARGRPRELREDLIQEVWAHLWSENCRVLQLWDRRGPLVHYVTIVAGNRTRDLLEKRTLATVPMDGLPDPPDPDDDPERTFEVQQLTECLARAKQRLSQTHRDLIHLRHELALKYEEIAQQLGKSIGYVGTTLRRAERYLREELLETCADHLGRFRSFF
jgi:RNA polymerase sigma-70 factor (ECF subfamily)